MATVANVIAWRAEVLEIAARLQRLEWPALRGSFKHADAEGRRASWGWEVPDLGALVVRCKVSGLQVASNMDSALSRCAADPASSMSECRPEVACWAAGLLAAAAELHRLEWPKALRGSFAHQDAEGLSQRYTWLARGTGDLVVFEKHSGLIKACSKPGQPFALAPAEEWAE